MRVALTLVVGLGLVAGPRARAAEGPTPLHTVHMEKGFIDDALALSPSGDRVAYVHSDGDTAQLIIERVGGGDKVTASLAGMPPAIGRLSFSVDGQFVLVVGDDRDKEVKVAQVFTVTGQPHKARLAPATDYVLATVGTVPVVMAFNLKSDKKGTSYGFTAFKLTDLKVLKKKIYTQDKQGLLKGLDMRVISYGDAYARIIGQRKGEFDKKNDIRKPENIAIVDTFTGKILSQTEITDPMAWAEVVKLRTERPAQEAFVLVEELKTAVLIDRESKKSTLKLAVPMHRYEPKTLQQRMLGDTLYFSLSVDPVNPDVTARGRTDRPDVDLYAVDLGERVAKRVLHLGSDRPVAWALGAGRIAVLRKYKNFSRGGVDLDVYPLPAK
jgi:hypothetical protein